MNNLRIYVQANSLYPPQITYCPVIGCPAERGNRLSGWTSWRSTGRPIWQLPGREHKFHFHIFCIADVIKHKV